MSTVAIYIYDEGYVLMGGSPMRNCIGISDSGAIYIQWNSFSYVGCQLACHSNTKVKAGFNESVYNYSNSAVDNNDAQLFVEVIPMAVA